MLNSAPCIETPRLILRAHTFDDFKVIADLWANPEMVRFIGGTPSTREASWTRLLRYVGHWQLLGFGYWVVVEKASGCFVGEVGLADYQREIEPSLHGKAEMGWVLSPAFHGRGYASEAVKAVLSWAEEHLQRPLCCIIAPENIRSIQLAEKHGFIHQVDTEYQAHPVRLYTRPTTEK